VIVRVALHFTVSQAHPAPRVPLHDALEALRALEVEAPTLEAGEHYGELLRAALERAGG
jgi:hypothetical protein